MAGRTFATGDIHGDLAALLRIEEQLPDLDSGDTLVFLGDYVNRGPSTAGVIEHLRSLSRRCEAKIVTLRGNHEDAWLRIIDQGWPEFVLPPAYGCLESMESYLGPLDRPIDAGLREVLCSGSFFPLDVVEWFRSLPFFYEDEHAIYVHAGLARDEEGRFLHPSRTEPQWPLMWYRDQVFFREYRGKRVVFGHTMTEMLPEELSSYTPDDPTDLWSGPCTVGLDTGAGRGGFLTTLELPSMKVYESR